MINNNQSLQVCATPSTRASFQAASAPTEMLKLLGEFTPVTMAMLVEYQEKLDLVLSYRKENENILLGGCPDTDLALRHALGTALKVVRADLKKTQGEWAVRQMRGALKKMGIVAAQGEEIPHAQRLCNL